MSGTSEGSKKAALTNKEKYGEDFFAQIGKKSWDNPDRSRVTGFALLTPEERSEKGRKGGSKTKEQYATNKKNTDEADRVQETLALVRKTKAQLQAQKDYFTLASEAQKDRPGASE